MKYLLILLFSLTLQAQSLLLLFSGEEPVTLPTWDWSMKPNEQMFTGGVATFGTELVTNGDFSSWTEDNPDGWTVSSKTAAGYITEASGKARIVSTAGSLIALYQEKATAGNYYKMGLDITTVVSGEIKFGTGANIQKAASTVGTHQFIFEPDGVTPYIKRTSICDITFDNVSLKQLTNFTPPTYVNDYSLGVNGTFNGGMETIQPGTNSTGIEKGFVFDGVNDYISQPCTTNSTVSSLSFWINFSNTGSEKYICGTTTGYIRKSSSEVIQASSGTIYLDGALYSGSAISAGWHLVTVSGITLSGTQLNIGASITPGGYLSGFIGNAHRYSGTMTAAQVKKLYDDEKAGYQ